MFTPEQVAEIQRIILRMDSTRNKLARRGELQASLSAPRSKLADELARVEQAIKDGCANGGLKNSQITTMQYETYALREALEEFDANTAELESLNEELAPLGVE